MTTFDLTAKIELNLVLSAEIEDKIKKNKANATHNPSTPEVLAVKRYLDSRCQAEEKDEDGEDESAKLVKRRRKSTGSQHKKAKGSDGKAKPPAELDAETDARVTLILPTTDTLLRELTPDKLVALIRNDGDLNTPAQQDRYIREMMCGFSKHDNTTWIVFLQKYAMHSRQKIGIAAAAAVPGAERTLLQNESLIQSLISSISADNYVGSRAALGEAVVHQAAWNALSTKDRAVYRAKPGYLDRVGVPRSQNQITEAPQLTINATRTSHSNVCGTNWQTLSMSYIYSNALSICANWAQFGVAALIHLATSLDNLGRGAPALSRISIRLQHALKQRPQLCKLIEARQEANVTVLGDFLRGKVDGEEKDNV
ncbi:hypothetical protein B0H16DRAFT_1476970 [Mycena metata]|uniref:Uncharacterized protein n=1 Tax=Mycena metata TaxID=1033252 RepID=A0AAD7MG45_9AGAR|nr:hypothetical protein B0H16DRAFT_1476970 [Mycena metata]